MQAQIKALEAGANKDNADAKNKEQDRLLKEQQKTIDEILEVMKNPAEKTDWKKALEIIISILGIGLPFLIKTLLNKNK